MRARQTRANESTLSAAQGRVVLQHGGADVGVNPRGVGAPGLWLPGKVMNEVDVGAGQ